MRETDFKKIKNFTKKEVERTGSSIDKVSFELIKKLDDFRDIAGSKIYLLQNGITTGLHKSIYHKNGQAVDFYMDKNLNEQVILEYALMCGFSGIGIYWNGKKYSYHFDLRKYFKFWAGLKDGKKWHYIPLIKSINTD